MKDIPFKCEHCGFEMSYTNDQSKPPEEPSWEELIEWPCQQLLGGTGAAIYSNTDGMCKHPLCHPKNNDVIESTPPPAPTEDEIEELLVSELNGYKTIYVGHALKVINKQWIEEITIKRLAKAIVALNK